MSFLQGGGELGALIRTKHWASTPMGDPATWPQNLRLALGICLSSKFPMHVWWGRELTLFYNDACVSFLGPGKHPSVLGRSGRQAWSEIWNQIGPMIDRVIASGEASGSEDVLMFFDRALPQEEVYVTFSFSPIRGEDGRLAGLFCASSEATEKIVGARRLETLRQLAKAAEARSVADACKAMGNAIANNPYDIPFARLYLVDDNGRRASLAAAVGHARPAWAMPDEIELEHRDTLWPLREVLAIRQTARTPLPADPRAMEVWPYATGDGIVLPIRAAGHGGLAGVLAVATSQRRPVDAAYLDFLALVQGHISNAISNARAYEDERRRAETLAEIDRINTTFFSNVSHEFRTPLSLMIGPLEEILSDRELAGPAREQLAMVHGNALRLLRLVNTLLDFSRVEAGRVQGSYVPVDLSAFTAELASAFRAACESAGLALRLDCPPLDEAVHIDVEMWEKIVLNLVSNAFKFTFEGEIEVSVRREGGHAVLSVRDTGIGIEAADLPRIFERFHRVDGARGRSYDGSGIGLALVRELVHLHGGTIGAQSTPDVGTRFIVRVPFGTAHLPAERVGGQAQPGPATQRKAFVEEALNWLPPVAARDAQAPVPAQAEGRGWRVLVVDDNADMRDYVRRLLQPHYHVETAAEGGAALAAIERNPPDLVLADIMMPGMDGLALLRAIRGNPLWSELPVVLLSARAGEESRVHGLEQGADDYLVKPFGAKELLARVRANLKMARLHRLSTERALRESQSRLQLALDASRMGTFVWHVQEDRGEPDPQMLALFGQPPDGALSLKAAMETMIHPEDRARYATAVERASDPEHGGGLREDVRVLMPDGRQRWLAITGQVSFDGEGRALTMSGAASDITERKEAEAVLQRIGERQAFLLRMSDALRPLADPAAIQEAATRMIGEYLGASRVGYAEDEGDGETVRVTGHYTHDAPPIEGRYRYRDYGEDQFAALRIGRTFVRADIANDPALSDAEKQAHARLQIGATITVPLMKAGRLGAVMFVHYAHACRLTADEVFLVETVGGRTWIAIERARVELALRESEERFRQFAEASSDVLWIRDAHTLRLEYLTPAFESIYGMSVDDALQGGIDPWLQFVLEEDRDRVLSILRRVSRGERATFEFRIARHDDGQVRWLRNTAFPIRDAAGGVIRIGGIGQDITIVKLAEERVRLSELRLRSAVEVGRLGTWDWNVKTGEVTWSDEHFRMAGYAVGEVCPSYQAWLSRVHPDDREAVEAALREAMARHSDYAREFRFVHPDGSVHWASARGRFFYDEAGDAVRMAGAMLETTERREWEETQKVLVAELQHRTRNIMAIVRSIADRTLASSHDADEFAERFRDRLDALARVQNLLSRLNETDRVNFDELLRTELSAHGALEHLEQLRLDGPRGVALRSRTVQPLAMALHELATNAVKYGALAQPGGCLNVQWRLVHQDQERPQLLINWKESGVCMEPRATRLGGGSGRELIEKALPYQIGAEVNFVLEEDGVRCDMSIPVSGRMSDPAADVDGWVPERGDTPPSPRADSIGP